MNIKSCELTDKNSAVKRMWFRLRWGSVGAAVVAPFWFVSYPKYAIRLVLVFGVGFLAYIVVGGYAFDLWRVRHPGASEGKINLLAFLFFLPWLIAILVGICVLA